MQLKLISYAALAGAVLAALAYVKITAHHAGYLAGKQEVEDIYRVQFEKQKEADDKKYQAQIVAINELEKKKREVITKIETRIKYKTKEQIVYEATDNSIISSYFVELYNSSTSVDNLQSAPASKSLAGLQPGVKTSRFIDIARQNNGAALVCNENYQELKQLYNNLERKWKR